MMLKLTYARKKDKLQTVTVIGDPAGISDLYWQLTKNHVCKDGTEIGHIVVENLSGVDVTADVLSNPYADCTRMNWLIR